MGKSALALTVGREFLLQDIPVAIFSLEMKADEISQRLIAMESGINTLNRKQGCFLSEEEIERLSAATDRVASWPLYCNDLATLTPAAIVMNARHAVRVEGAKVIIIDYLQIISPGDDRQDNRTRVEKASRAMAKMAKELDIPVICLAQLNRESLKRVSCDKWQDFEKVKNTGRPKRGDLRETAQIEMDADAIIGIYRPEVFFRELRPFETAGKHEDLINFDIAARSASSTGAFCRCPATIWWSQPPVRRHRAGRRGRSRTRSA